jgi:CheY-like chemotaxis protein
MISSLGAYTILVVDDSPVYHKLVSDVLANESYTPLFAENGEEALKSFLHPLSIDCDYELEYAGFLRTGTLQAHPRPSKLPLYLHHCAH